MPCPPDLLVTPAQLPRYNVPSAFLAQFALRAFVVRIAIAGALGTMRVEWQRVGEDSDAWSAPIVSAAGSSWLLPLDDVYAEVTFPAGTYVAQSTYTIDENGAVVVGGGGISGVTAERYDLRETSCSAVTAEALKRMRDAIRQPLLTWGDDARMHAAAWVYGKLKRAKGATPEGAGVGDENVFSGEKMAIEFFDNIGRNGRPDDMTDTSPTTDGPLIPIYPIGDTPRGW